MGVLALCSLSVINKGMYMVKKGKLVRLQNYIVAIKPILYSCIIK